MFHLLIPTRKWRQRYDTVSAKLDDASRIRTSTLRKIGREETMKMPLGALHPKALTEEEIDKYKREQIERYEREQKENELLLKQIKEGKIALPSPDTRTSDDKFPQPITEEQKRQQNERLKTQVMYLQVSRESDGKEKCYYSISYFLAIGGCFSC